MAQLHTIASVRDDLNRAIERAEDKGQTQLASAIRGKLSRVAEIVAIRNARASLAQDKLDRFAYHNDY